MIKPFWLIPNVVKTLPSYVKLNPIDCGEYTPSSKKTVFVQVVKLSALVPPVIGVYVPDDDPNV